MAQINVEELKERLADAKAKPEYSERHACCWQGYLAALVEWGIITPGQHKELSDEMPVNAPDPSLQIFLG